MTKAPKNLETGEAPLPELSHARDYATKVEESVYVSEELREWLTDALTQMKLLSGYLNTAEQQDKFDRALRPIVAAVELTGSRWRKEVDANPNQIELSAAEVAASLKGSDPT